MGRRQTLTNQDILRRARPVFLDRGLGARTRDIAAAVGLTWGAIALRFGNKRALFEKAMGHRSECFEEAPSGFADDAELAAVLRRLAAVLQRHAEHGEIRSDLPPQSLATLPLAALTGAAAERFVRRQRGDPTDDAPVETMLRLLEAKRPWLDERR